MSIVLFKSKIVFLALASLFFFVPLSFSADDYDYYVDSSASSGGDGSKKEPFKNISDAIEEGGDIFIENGDYDEKLRLKKGTKLYGKDEGKVVITGEIKMEDDTALRDLTIKDVDNPVIIDADADVEINNCTIKDFDKTGINTLTGGGKIKVVNSKIKNGGGKGFYIERGKEVELIGNEVTENEEEGIDIRSKVDGIIKNNFIVGNGESGIEVVVGNSYLTIKDNKIKKNGSSGIASQFYPDSGLSDKGDIKIENNDIEENDKYGFDCNRPQGGSPGDDYWRDSVELEGNEILGNGIQAISDYCKFIKAVDENEEVDNSINNTSNHEEKEKEPELTEEEKAEIEKELELERQRKQEVLKETEDLLIKNQELSLTINNQIAEMEKISSVKRFFLGIDQEKIKNLKSNLNIKDQQIQQTKLLLEEIDWEEERKENFKNNLTKTEEDIEKQKNFLKQQSSSFSIWGWLSGLFK
jgi:hypothetical protein